MESFNNILLVSATESEIAPLLEKLGQPVYENSFIKEYYLSENTNLDVVVTGVGVPFTMYKIMRIFGRIKYDLVLNVGIAGTLKDEYAVGSIVNVVTEEFFDLGVMENNGYQSIFDKNFIGLNDAPFNEGKLINIHSDKYPIVSKLPKVAGITANVAHAYEGSATKILDYTNADVESMEGAAIFYVCLLQKMSFLEIRAISNKVDARVNAQWNLPLAIENLNNFTLDVLKSLTVY